MFYIHYSFDDKIVLKLRFKDANRMSLNCCDKLCGLSTLRVEMIDGRSPKAFVTPFQRSSVNIALESLSAKAQLFTKTISPCGCQFLIP